MWIKGLVKLPQKEVRRPEIRSGGGVRPGVPKIGRMPHARRLPKRGFTNIFAKEYATVNVSDLEKLDNVAIGRKYAS